MNGQSSTYQLFVMFGIVLGLVALVWWGRGGHRRARWGGVMSRVMGERSSPNTLDSGAPAGGDWRGAMHPSVGAPLTWDAPLPPSGGATDAAGGLPTQPAASAPLPTDLRSDQALVPTAGLVSTLTVGGRVADTKTLLKGVRFTAGRAPACTIRVEELEQTRRVSRNHLTATVLEGGVLIENTASLATICLDNSGTEVAMRQGEIRRLGLPATVFLTPGREVQLTLVPFGR